MPPKSLPSASLTDTWGRANRVLEDRLCETCRSIFRPKRKSSRFCCRPCAWKQNGGHNRKPVSWWRNAKGYIEGRMWLADGTQLRIKQHRFIAEGFMGRPLKPWEDVHHKNGRRDDNRPDNLEVISHGEHSTKHNGERSYRRGYQLRLTPEELQRRSIAALRMGLAEMGRAAIAKATKGAS